MTFSLDDSLDGAIEEKRKLIMLYIISVVALAALVPMGIVAYYQNNVALGLVDHTAAILIVLNLIYIWRTGKTKIPSIVGISIAGTLFVYLFATGGVNNTGHLWYYTFPLIAAFLLGYKGGAIATGLLLLFTVIFIGIDPHNSQFFTHYDHNFMVRFFPSFLVVFACAYAFEKLRKNAQNRLVLKNTELEQVVLQLKEKEIALQKSHNTLENRVNERTADLAKINTELQASHELFTTVLNSISANIYVAHIDTDEILFMNKHMQDEFGGNFIGQKCYRALKKADERCPFCPAPVLVDSKGKPTNGYIWESFNETTQRWYLNNDRAITWVDGQMVRLEVSIDVTDQKEAESALLKLNEDLEKRVADRTSELAEKNELLQTEIEEHELTERELRQSEERFRQAVDNSPNPIFTVDVNGRIQDWNKSFNEVFKYTKDVMDQDVIFLFPDKENRTAVRKMLSDALEQKNLTDVELCYRCDDGSHRYMVSRVYPVFNQHGKIDHCVFTNTDITERKHALLELNSAKDHAEAASRAKSDFLANMSHELRTPLNHIIGFSEMIVDQHFGDLNPTQVEYLNDVLQSAKHLLSLVNDILDISKVEAGKLELEAEPVDIRQLLENSLIMVKEKALRHGIRLSLDMDGIPKTIIADERKLKQVLYNLLANAVKFTPDGGKVNCTASVSEPAECIKISVIDTGIGIDPDDLPRIFQPFEQVDGSISRQFGGTGLGLSLTQKLVELHGGKIWAESVIDKQGSRFHFTIPIENDR